jgi:hypothetical protein
MRSALVAGPPVYVEPVQTTKKSYGILSPETVTTAESDTDWAELCTNFAFFKYSECLTHDRSANVGSTVHLKAA